MNEDKLIDLVLKEYNIQSTPEIRELLREFIRCDLTWFKENFTEEQSEDLDVDDDNPEDECHSRLCDYSLCDKSDNFSYYDNCFK